MKLRRTATPLLLAALAFGSVAATDENGVELPTQTCANDGDLALLTEGQTVNQFSASAVTYPSGTVPGLTEDPSHDDDPANLDPMTRVSFDYLVDVVAEDGSAENDFAFLNFTLEWDSPSDHELFVYDEDGEVLFEGTAFNPISGSIESGTLTVDQCTVLTFETKNYLGVPAEPMTLKINTTGRDAEPNTTVGG